MFEGNQPEEAAVIRMHQGSRVYADAASAVSVYDSSTQSHTQPWLVRLPTPADAPDGMLNTSIFLTERDQWFADTVQVRSPRPPPLLQCQLLSN